MFTIADQSGYVLTHIFFQKKGLYIFFINRAISGPVQSAPAFQ